MRVKDGPAVIGRLLSASLLGRPLRPRCSCRRPAAFRCVRPRHGALLSVDLAAATAHSREAAGCTARAPAARDGCRRPARAAGRSCESTNAHESCHGVLQTSAIDPDIAGRRQCRRAGGGGGGGRAGLSGPAGALSQTCRSRSSVAASRSAIAERASGLRPNPRAGSTPARQQPLAVAAPRPGGVSKTSDTRARGSAGGRG